jgi:hypothetical protein
MAIRFEPKVPDPQKTKPAGAAPIAPTAPTPVEEPAKPAKTKGKASARGSGSTKSIGESK